MATRIPRKVLNSLKGRVLYSQAAAAPAPAEAVSLPRQAPKVTSLPNGLIVASLENYSPVSSVSVVVNAGPRFETGNNLGVTHCLRASAGLTNEKTSRFKITRAIQQTGGSLSVTSTREYLFYSVDCTRNNLSEVIPYLREVVTAPTFKPWEVDDIRPQLKLDLAVLDTQPEVKTFELLHEAAFRNNLGRSLYAPEFKIGTYNSEQLLHYVKSNFTSGRMALVGTGVDHDLLVAEAKKFTPFSSSTPSTPAAKYYGGELRQNMVCPLTFAAVAVEGPSLSAEDLMSGGILQFLMGTGPYIKYSNNTTVSKLGQAVSKAASSPFAVSCIQANYTDSGLFGFSAVAQPHEIGPVLKAAFNQFAAITKGNIDDADLARAKKQLKSYTLMLCEQQGVLNMDLGLQALMTQSVVPMQDWVALVDKITAADVSALAKKMINSKPSMAAVGDLSQTPYLEDLYK